MTSNPLYLNSATSNIVIQGPYLNQLGNGQASGSPPQCINQLSQYLIVDNSSGISPNYYFKAVASFMLLGSILDTAPASSQVTGQIPNITMSINSVGTQNYLVSLTLSAGGRTAMTPTFQTQTTNSGLIFILSNYFQITAPGILYTVTCEGNALTNNSLFPS